MAFWQAGALLLAALIGGALNSVAGGGSFFTFPALLLLGVPSVNANATSAVALWPGSVASAGAYRAELGGEGRQLALLGGISVLGGILGAQVLLHTSQELFLRMVPFLLLLATLVFAFGGQVSRWLRARWAHGDARSSASAGQVNVRHPSRRGLAGTLLFQFVVAFYGGFFGGGIGILMLALLSFLGMRNIHQMNALKTVLAVCINGVAVIVFIAAGAVFWPEALIMIMGTVAGGYGGATIARRLDPKLIRRAVILIGFALSIYFFIRTYG